MDGAVGWPVLCAWLGFPAWPETRQPAGRHGLSAGIVTKQRPSREFQQKKNAGGFFNEIPGAAWPGCEPGIKKKKRRKVLMVNEKYRTLQFLINGLFIN